MDIRITGSVSLEDHDEIEEILHDTAQEFLPRFGIDSNFRLAVYVCKDAPEFTQLTGAHGWNGGHFVNRIIYIQRLDPLKRKGILTQTLKHEFLHYCIWRKAGNNIPLWLNEGIVMNLTGEFTQFDCPDSSKDENMTTEQIELMIHSKNIDDVRKGYCLAAFRAKKCMEQHSLEECLRLKKPRTLL